MNARSLARWNPYDRLRRTESRRRSRPPLKRKPPTRSEIMNLRRFAWLAALLAMPLFAGAFATHPVNAQDTPTVTTRDAGALGTILINANGFTLYVFDRDTPGTSACTGG